MKELTEEEKDIISRANSIKGSRSWQKQIEGKTKEEISEMMRRIANIRYADEDKEDKNNSKD